MLEYRAADDVGASCRSRERDLELRRGLRCSVAAACTSVPPGTLGRLAHAWQAAARPVALALALLPGAGTVAAQSTPPAAVTLTASGIEDTTATLTISGHTESWWYKTSNTFGYSADVHQCTAVAAGTGAVTLSGLTAVRPYEYTAYSDSTCNTELAKVEFRTLAPEGKPTVSVSDVQQYEDETWMTFIVSLSAPSRDTVTVDVYTSDGTATRNTDYRSVSRKLTFRPNSMNVRQPVPVLVYDDQEVEPDETFTVTLTNPTGATLGDDATATGTIKNDGDTAVKLTASGIGDTTATLTISGHKGSWWYRARDTRTSQWGTCTAVAAGKTAVGISGLTAVKSYEYTAYSDSTCTTKLATVEFRTIAPLGTPTVSVSDVQGPEDETWMTFEVSLSAPSRDTVTVDVATSGGTATSGTDYRSVSEKLTFPPNSTDAQHANVLVYDDQDLEPDETFTVTLTNPTGATLGDATATGTIRNDDTAAKLAASDIGNTTATLTISGHTGGWWYRGQDSGTSKWGTCTAVAAGTTAVGISGLTAVRTYEYTAYSNSTCTTKLAKVEFRTLAPKGTPTVSVSDVRRYEDQTWMTFEVSLSAPSRETVKVDVKTSDGTATSGTDYRSVSRTLTFSPNSRSPQHVPVLVYDDQDLEPDETFTVTLTNPTGATLGDSTATGTIRNDEAMPPSDMMASGATQTTVDLAWTLPEQPRGITVRAVEVQRQEADATWSAEATLAAAAASHTVTGLSAGAAYSFRTRLATNKGNADSEPVSATTLEAEEAEAAAVTGVAVSSRPATGDTYVFGETIRVALTFDATVDVDTGGGTPHLSIDMDPAEWGEKQAAYESGSGTDTLTFAHAVVEPNISTQGIAVLANTLALNGGTIRSASGEDAELAHAGLGHDPKHKVDWRHTRSNNAPVINEQAEHYDDFIGARPAPRGMLVWKIFEDFFSDPDGDELTYSASVPADQSQLVETLEARFVSRVNGYPDGLHFVFFEADADDDWKAVTPALADPLSITATVTATDPGGLSASVKGDFRVDWVSHPALLSAVASPEAIELTFDQAVQGTPGPAGRQFTVNVVDGDGSAGTLAVRRVSVSGAVVTLELASALQYGQTVTLDYTHEDAAPLRRAAGGGDATPDFTGQAVSVDITPPAPTVTGVAVTSNAGDDNTYRLNDVIRVTVTFSEAVDVSGTPRLKIDMDPAEWGEKRAVYESGGGTAALTFTHAVVEPNLSTRGIAVLADSLELNGGAIRSAATGADAELSHAGLGHDPSHKVDWRPEAVAVTGVSVTSDAGGDDTYRRGDTISIRVTFSEAVDVSGTPRLKIDMDPAEWGEKWVSYGSGGGTAALTFTHAVVEPNLSTRGIAVLADSLELNGGAIRSAATEADAELSHAGLGHDPSHKVDWRPGLSVADAKAEEGVGAVVEFAVRLALAATRTVTVDYATADGTARAGEDYTASSGTLTFAVGESSRTVSVAVLDDAHDEGEETFVLRLSNASGAWLEDAEATGTIENTDLMPAALLARFGRATAEQVVEHIEERMAAPRQRGFRARFAGREFQRGQERDFALGFLSQFAQPMGAGVSGATPLGGAAMGGTLPAGMGSLAAIGVPGVGMGGATGAGGLAGGGMGVFGMGMTGMAGSAGAMGMGGRHAPIAGAPGMAGYGPMDGAHGGGLAGTMLGHDPLSNSAFELNRESRGGILSVWSRSSRSYFSGMEEALSLDGDVRTTMFGADYSRGALTVGLSVGRTLGLGGYSGPSGGRMTTSMTGFYPWVGYQVNDRVSVWGVTGYGTGSLSLTPDGASALETGVSMAMSAVGTRGELIGSRATGGFALAFKADALWVGAASELLDGPTGRLNASEAGVTRVRTALEGSRGFTVGGRLSLTPTVEVGLRRDGGDAETGAGMDVGGGLVFTDTVTGLSLDLRVRTLVVHQAEGFTERGMSLSFGWDPTPSSPLGLTAKVAPSWGGQAQGGAEALWGNQMVYGMGSHQMYGSGDRVDAEVGYGLPVGARFVGTPRVGLTTSQYGRDYRVGYGLGVLDRGKVNLDLGVDAQRRESPMQGEASNGFLGRATLGW